MRLALPKFVRHARLLFATAVAITIAASTTLAQLGSFDSSFDGELWGVRHELVPANGGTPAGVLFVNGTLYVVDSANDTVIAYDATGNVVPMPGAQWDALAAGSPVSGMELHALGAAVVTVNGTDRAAMLISDEKANRVAAFDTTGAHLFTLRLARPSTVSPLLWLTLGQVAVSPGGKFTLNTATQALTLSGTFAAAWYEQTNNGEGDSGAMVFPGSTVFVHNGTDFEVTPSTILRGNENDPVAPDPARVFGVTFDSANNLYVLDAFNERLHVYGPAFDRLFTFGTPIAGGGTAEFYEPWGIAYWPDANGGRIFVADTYNSRINVYRPTDTPDSAPGIDALQLESVIKGFVPSVPKISLFAIAVDPSSGSIAVSDFADNDDGGHPRAVVLQRARLAAFNLQLLDANDAVTSSVCLGAGYKVRFSLTVTPGQADVRRVVPQLTINGVTSAVQPVPAASYPAQLTLSAGQVATFTYSLTAPSAQGDITLLAAATASNTTDILGRSGFVYLADCAAETDLSSITATPNLAPQVSGWTPVREFQSYSVALDAEDADGISTIEYRLEGANNSGDVPIAVAFDGVQTVASHTVPLPEFGRSALHYRVRDGNGIWSPLQTLNVRPKQVVDRIANENIGVEFRVGDPEGIGFTYSVSGLPAGATFSTATGQFAGVISFDAVNPYSSDPIISSGVYPVVVTETAPGGATSQVGFTWTINHVNRTPIITNPPVLAGSLTINQGELFEMDIEGFDPDGDPSVFTLHATGSNGGHILPSSITINPVTGLISGIFPVDADASYDFSVGLAECGVQTPAPPCNVEPLPGARQATFFDFQLAVLDINHPADIVSPGDQTSAEGDAVSLAVKASDPEDDLLTFQAGGLPAGLSIARLDRETALITGTIAFGSAGTYAVTVVADDHVNTEKRSVTFSWVVTFTNRPPALSIPDKISIENGPATGNVLATDPNSGDTLTYSAIGLPPGASMSAGGVFSGGFDYNASGVYTVTVTVSDGASQTQDTFIWTVENVNRPPTLVTPPRLNAVGDMVAVTLNATDPDGDALSFSYNGLPSDLTLNTTTGQITGTLSLASAGIYNVNVAVSDGKTSALNSFVWTVTGRPPVVEPIANKTNSEGDVISLPAIAVTDPDGDLVFTFSATNLPPGLSINPLTGAIAGSLPYTSAGTYSVSITVTDAKGGQATVSFTWTVINVNRPPDLINPGTQTSLEGAVIDRPISASDPDLQTLTYSATGLPPDLSINSATGTITGTIAYTAAPSYTVTLTASDGSSSDSETFIWNVTNVNRVPTADPDLSSVVQGQSVVINVLGNDDTAGGLALSVTGVTPPSNGSVAIDGSGTAVTYTATSPTFAGVATFFYTVSNGEATATALVTVTVLPSNTPPVCTAAAVSPGSIWPPNHKPVYLSLSGITDADGDPLTIKFTSVLQDEATNTTGDGNTTQDAGIEENGTRVWVRAERRGDEDAVYYGRVYIVGFTATDDKVASCSGTVFVGVPHDQGNHNQPIPSTGRWNSQTGAMVLAPAPKAVNDSVTVKKNTPQVVAVQANDVVYGGALLTIASAPASGVAIANANGTVTYTPALNWTGRTSFTYRLTNGQGSDTAVVSVTVKK